MKQKTLEHTSLSPVEREALAVLRQRLFAEFDFVEELILFGSAARGTADEESDIDLLVLTKYPLDNWRRHEISCVASDVNLSYETNICTVVIDAENWHFGIASVLPFKLEVLEDGLPV